MRAPEHVVRIVEEDYLGDFQGYRDLLWGLFRPGTYWSWTGPSVTLFRVIARDDDGIDGESHNLRDGTIWLTEGWAFREMAPDQGFVLESSTEEDWLCAVLAQ